MFQGGTRFSLKTKSQYIFPMSYSKPMPALMAAAAGNYITMWLPDFTGLLRFPRRGPFLIYDFVIRLFSAMFYCEKDKPMCQREPVRVAGTLRWEFSVIDDLCVSQDVQRSWPLFVSYQSLRLTLPGSRTFFDDWGFMEMLCLLYLWGQEVSGVESGGLLHRVLQNL